MHHNEPHDFTHIVFIYWYNIATILFRNGGSNGSVTYDHITKEFGEVVAVNDLNLAIDDKEFIVLVAPQAAGKPLLYACWQGWKKSPKAK